MTLSINNHDLHHSHRLGHLFVLLVKWVPMPNRHIHLSSVPSFVFISLTNASLEVRNPIGDQTDSSAPNSHTLYNPGHPDESKNDKWPILLPIVRKALHGQKTYIG